jgi:ADP-ribosylglycohydrolase
MNHLPPADPLTRATISLEGLSVGDALGAQYFVDSLSATIAPDLIAARMLPSPRWYYTDDTEMALSLCSILS